MMNRLVRPVVRDKEGVWVELVAGDSAARLLHGTVRSTSGPERSGVVQGVTTDERSSYKMTKGEIS